MWGFPAMAAIVCLRVKRARGPRSGLLVWGLNGGGGAEWYKSADDEGSGQPVVRSRRNPRPKSCHVKVLAEFLCARLRDCHDYTQLHTSIYFSIRSAGGVNQVCRTG